MDFNNKLFEVEFTEECVEEILDIYEYISINLKESSASKKLMTEVTYRILNLSSFPQLYMKIAKTDKLKKDYYRIVIKNYIVLYTIDFNKKKVFVSHMIYKRRNYLNYSQ